MCLWFQLVLRLHYTSSHPGFCMINTSLDSFGACSSQLANRKNCIFNLVYFLSNTESCCVHFCKQRHAPGCLDTILTSFSPEWLGKSGVVKGTTNCKGCLCSSAARQVNFPLPLSSHKPTHSFPSSQHSPSVTHNILLLALDPFLSATNGPLSQL